MDVSSIYKTFFMKGCFLLFFILQPFLEKYKKQLAIMGGVVAAVLIYLLFLDESSHSAAIETIDQMTIPLLMNLPQIRKRKSKLNVSR